MSALIQTTHLQTLHSDPDKCIDRFINCLFLPDDLVEIRLLPGRHSSWHLAKDIPGLMDRLSQKNAAGEDIYFGVNPRIRKGGKAQDVKLARYIFADFDHTDVETVRERLALMEFPEPTIIINSGHGVHCYWRLTQATADLQRWSQTQKRLIRHLNSDPKVCDAPRIMRMPGFMNHKEPSAQAEIIEINPTRRYTLEDMERVLPPLPTPSVSHKPAVGNSTSSSVDERAIAYVLKCEPSISGQRGHDRAFAAARAVVYGFDLGVEKGLQILLANYNPACQPPWSEAELLHKCQEADTTPFDKPRGWLLDQNNRRHARTPSRNNHQQAPVKPGDEEPYSDLWNARKVVDRYGERLRYVSLWGKWIAWDGVRWRLDEDGEVMRFAKATIDHLLKLTEQEKTELNQTADVSSPEDKKDKEECKAATRHAKQSANAGRLKAMVELASTEPGMPVSIEQLNQHAFLLNCPNGTVDLKTGTLRSADRAELLTKLCPTSFDPQATCPRWETFLHEIMGGNQLLIEYLERAVGYSLTGSTSEHALFFCHGTGANGKSVFLGTVQTVLGREYSMQAMPELLMAKHSDRHPTELADLFGMRMVAINETEQDRQLAESLMKQLTGGDRIRARQMRQDFWEFSPTHKIWLAGNHKPKIKGQDHGIWRRLHLIPFQVTIPPEKQDKNLGTILIEEAPGILAWAVRGCLEWQKQGLNPPPEVLEATATYRQEQDDLGAFLEECCIQGTEYAVASDVLRESYSDWLGSNKPVTRNSFSTTMEAKGFQKGRSTITGRVMWQGVTLRPETTPSHRQD